MRPDRTLFGVCVLTGCWLLFGPTLPKAQAQKKNAQVRIAGVYGALLTPAAKGQWTSLAANGDLPPDQLLIALFGAEFQTSSGGVLARVVADIGQRGPFPVLEAAFRFHQPKKADLDITLERGILILTNTKKKGPAHIRLRLRAETFDLTLSQPKARLGIEVYGRHLPGPPKLSSLKADDPIANIAIFALAGESVISTSTETSRLQAPPGPALFIWNNVTSSAEVVRFEALPDFATPMNATERKQFEAIAALAKTWAAKPGGLGNAVNTATTSRDALERRASVVALGALDDLPGLLRVLNNKDHADTRDLAIVVIRHWLGREAGQSIRMYDYVTKAENATAIQAKNLLYLFNGIEAEKRRQPETYELLIQALDHGKIAARELARWHLVRLAPAGRSIPYDAAGTDAERQAGIAAWRRLIPAGQLPPSPKGKSSN
ncbi:MAG: hypothetical protein HYX68_27475 [Planctomycetes bacterium]|nr:hypothetical protein [Planctomycetota bacterium]